MTNSKKPGGDHSPQPDQKLLSRRTVIGATLAAAGIGLIDKLSQRREQDRHLAETVQRGVRSTVDVMTSWFSSDELGSTIRLVPPAKDVGPVAFQEKVSPDGTTISMGVMAGDVTSSSFLVRLLVGRMDTQSQRATIVSHVRIDDIELAQRLRRGEASYKDILERLQGVGVDPFAREDIQLYYGQVMEGSVSEATLRVSDTGAAVYEGAEVLGVGASADEGTLSAFINGYTRILDTLKKS